MAQGQQYVAEEKPGRGQQGHEARRVCGRQHSELAWVTLDFNQRRHLYSVTVEMWRPRSRDA